MYKEIFYIVHVYAPIVIGALIYTLFREDVLLIFRIYEQLFFSEWLIHIRESTMHWDVSSYVRYTLPDALWVYAFASFLCVKWVGEPTSTWRTAFIVLPFLLGPGSEVAQFIFPTLGTFDVIDLYSMVLAYIAAYSVSKYVQKEWYHGEK